MSKTKLKSYTPLPDYNRGHFDNAGYRQLYGSIIAEIAKGRGDRVKHENYIGDNGSSVSPAIKKGWTAGYRAFGKAWDYDLFRAYIEKIKAQDNGSDLWGKFQELHIKWGVSVHSWNRATSNSDPCLTTDSVERLFSAAAQTLKVPLMHYVAGYLTFCEDNNAAILGIEGKMPDAFKLRKQCGQLLKSPKSLYADSFIDFDQTIESISEKATFYREKMYQNIENILIRKDPGSGFICIVGPPGSGKSSILTHVLEYLKKKQTVFLCWHYNRIGSGFNSTKAFMLSLWEQLSNIFCVDEYEKLLQEALNNVDTAPRFLYKLLNYISINYLNAFPLVIIVDALDEVNKKVEKTTNGTNNTLGIPSDLPKNIFFLISSRNFANEHYRGKIDTIDLSPNSVLQNRDLGDYIKLRKNESTIRKWFEKQISDNGFKLNNEKIVESITKRAESNFLYIQYMLSDPELLSMRGLPKGISGYYQEQYNRLLPVDDESCNLIIRVLAALNTFNSGFSWRSSDRVSAMIGGVDVFKVDALLKPLVDSGFLLKKTVNSFFFYKFYHLSFALFLFSQDVNTLEVGGVSEIQKTIRGVTPCFEVGDALWKCLERELGLLDGKFSYQRSMPPVMKLESFVLLIEYMKNKENIPYMKRLLAFPDLWEELDTFTSYKPRDFQNFINYMAFKREYEKVLNYPDNSVEEYRIKKEAYYLNLFPLLLKLRFEGGFDAITNKIYRESTMKIFIDSQIWAWGKHIEYLWESGKATIGFNADSYLRDFYT